MVHTSLPERGFLSAGNFRPGGGKELTGEQRPALVPHNGHREATDTDQYVALGLRWSPLGHATLPAPWPCRRLSYFRDVPAQGQCGKSLGASMGRPAASTALAVRPSSGKPCCHSAAALRSPSSPKPLAPTRQPLRLEIGPPPRLPGIPHAVTTLPLARVSERVEVFDWVNHLLLRLCFPRYWARLDDCRGTRDRSFLLSHPQAAARGRSGKEATQASSAGVDVGEGESPRRRKAKELGAKTCILLTGPLPAVWVTWDKAFNPAGTWFL